MPSGGRTGWGARSSRCSGRRLGYPRLPARSSTWLAPDAYCHRNQKIWWNTQGTHASQGKNHISILLIFYLISPTPGYQAVPSPARGSTCRPAGAWHDSCHARLESVKRTCRFDGDIPGHDDDRESLRLDIKA